MANQSTEAVESPQHKTLLLLLLLMFLFFWLAAAYFFLHLFGWLWAKVCSCTVSQRVGIQCDTRSRQNGALTDGTSVEIATKKLNKTNEK